MERITYNLLTKTLTAPDVIVCNADNDTIELAIDSTGTIYETWEKRCDLAMPDGTTDILGFDPAVTDVIAVFTLTSAHLKKGALVINPYVQDSGARKGFPKKSVQVVSQLSNDSATASVQVLIEDYINERLTVKSVTATTLAPSEPATLNFTIEADGVTAEIGVPKGEKGDTGSTITSAEFVADDIVFTKDDETTVSVVGGKTAITPVKNVDYFDGELTIAGLDDQLPLKTYTRNQLKPKKVILQKLTDIRAILGSNLVAFYPLNDFEGTTAKDHSGANTHVTLSPSDITHVPSPFDEVNSAMKFAGTNSFINLVAIKDKFNGNTGAIFFDMKYEDLSEWQVGSKRLFSFYKDGNNRLWGGTGVAALNVSRYANGVLKTVTFTNQQTAANGVAFDKPFQVLATWNRTNLDLYINGILASTTTSTEEFIGVPSICAYGADSASASALNVKGTHGNLGLANRYVEAHEAKEIYNATNNQGVSLTIIGDSISNDSVDWPVYFLNNQSTYNVMRSKAVAGNSIATHMTTQTTEALKDNYDTVVILMGANDDNAGDMVALQSTVESNLSRLKRKNADADIYVINVLPIWTNNTGLTVVDKSNIRTAIASACTSQGVTCWDSFGEQWIVASDTSDGVHPTNAGSLKLALKVKEKLGL